MIINSSVAIDVKYKSRVWHQFFWPKCSVSRNREACEHARNECNSTFIILLSCWTVWWTVLSSYYSKSLDFLGSLTALLSTRLLRQSNNWQCISYATWMATHVQPNTFSQQTLHFSTLSLHSPPLPANAKALCLVWDRFYNTHMITSASALDDWATKRLQSDQQ